MKKQLLLFFILIVSFLKTFGQQAQEDAVSWFDATYINARFFRTLNYYVHDGSILRTSVVTNQLDTLYPIDKSAIKNSRKGVMVFDQLDNKGHLIRQQNQFEPRDSLKIHEVVFSPDNAYCMSFSIFQKEEFPNVNGPPVLKEQQIDLDVFYQGNTFKKISISGEQPCGLLRCAISSAGTIHLILRGTSTFNIKLGATDSVQLKTKETSVIFINPHTNAIETHLISLDNDQELEKMWVCSEKELCLLMKEYDSAPSRSDDFGPRVEKYTVIKLTTTAQIAWVFKFDVEGSVLVHDGIYDRQTQRFFMTVQLVNSFFGPSVLKIPGKKEQSVPVFSGSFNSLDVIVCIDSLGNVPWVKPLQTERNKFVGGKPFIDPNSHQLILAGLLLDTAGYELKTKKDDREIYIHKSGGLALLFVDIKTGESTWTILSNRINPTVYSITQVSEDVCLISVEYHSTPTDISTLQFKRPIKEKEYVLLAGFVTLSDVRQQRSK